MKMVFMGSANEMQKVSIVLIAENIPYMYRAERIKTISNIHESYRDDLRERLSDVLPNLKIKEVEK